MATATTAQKQNSRSVRFGNRVILANYRLNQAAGGQSSTLCIGQGLDRGGLPYFNNLVWLAATLRFYRWCNRLSRIYLLQTRSDQQNEWTDLEGCYYFDPFQAVAKAGELKGSLLVRSQNRQQLSAYRIVEYICGSPTSSCHVIETLTNPAAGQLEATLLQIPAYECLELAANNIFLNCKADA